MTVLGPGKRETQRRRKTAAIVEAATELFRSGGYDSVTTQMIAERAGVTNGTFFRHVGSKSELLVRVVNNLLATGHDEALESLQEGATASEAILHLLEPLHELSLENPELATAYVREVAFAGTALSTGSVEQIAQMREAIERILRESDAARADERDEDFYDFAANVVFSSICLEIVRVSMGRSNLIALPDKFRDIAGRLVQILLR